MNFNIGTLVYGKPRFNDSALMHTAMREGIDVAWQQAFQRSGVNAPAGVSGDFSVGLHESDGRVFLAVDRFAIRTLCYRQVGDQILFAERADDLADLTTEIDPQAIFEYLYFHAIPSPRTIFKDIYRVPPGHYVLYENKLLTVAPYWEPTFEEALNQPFDKLRNEFRTLLQQATVRQLDDGKAACFLSGGTDSSTLAGMIGLAHGTPAATYSIGFEAEGYDEMAFARIASKCFKTEHHEYYVTPNDLVQSIPKVAASYDQPFGNSSALPAYYCAKMAKEDGVTCILAGDGGDELFGGNSRYAKQRVFDWYQYIPGAVRKMLMEPLLGNKVASSLPLIRKASSYVEQAAVPMPDRLQMYNLITRLGLNQSLTQDFLAQVDISLPLKHQHQVWAGAQTSSNLNRHLAFDWRYTLAEIDLPKVTGTTRLAGLQVGFPMLDSDLLAFSQRLPVDYKLNGMKLRWFFKEALRGFLPDEIIAKTKQGFGLPFGVWAIHNEALLQLASESVRGLADRGVLRKEFVDTLLTKHLYNYPGYFGEMIWISMMLEQWLRAHAPGFSISNR